jgi:hypothetical protein
MAREATRKMRKGPAGDHVFVLETDLAGNTRAHARPVDVSALLGKPVLLWRGVRV